MPKFAELANKPSALKRREIQVEEWGGTFWVCEVTGLQHQEITESFRSVFGDDDVETAAGRYAGRTAAILLSRCLVDEDGEHPSEDWLIGQSISLLNRLSQEAMEINGMSASAQAQAEKNS